MLKWGQLRSKLLLLFIGLLLVPILGTGIYVRLYFREQLQDQTITLAQHDVSAQLSHLETRFIDAQQNLRFLSELRALQVLENSAPATELYQSSLQVLSSDLSNFAQTHLIYHHIAIYNPIGEPIVLLNSIEDEIQIFNNQPPNAYGEFVSQVLPAPADTLHLAVNQDINNRTSTIIMALRTEQSVIILESWSEWLFRPAIDADNAIGTWSVQLPIQAVLHYTSIEQDTLSPALSSNDSWLRESQGYYQDSNNLVLFERVTIPTQQESYDLVLFHTLPQYHFQADLSDFYGSYGLLTIGVLLCVIALALFAIDRFIDPIEQLKEAVDMMRKTQKSPELPKQLPPDEIGELSLAFYTMATELANKRQSERALVDKLITAQEAERKRIAYELHDGLIQQLVGARLQLSQGHELLKDEQTQKTFSHGYEALSTAIVEGRRIMQGLHPSILDDLGIREALRELCEIMATRAGWQVQLDLRDLTHKPDKITSVTLYRIAQEALSNALKHADASTIHVKLWRDDGYHLLIKDDGHGFVSKPLPKPNGGWGLRTMTERVDLLYGNIDIDSSIGGGTAIEICLPQKTLKEGTKE